MSTGSRAPRAANKSPQRHGLHGIPEYRVWNTMICRCSNKSSRVYPAYGGRGIRVCDRWMLFEHFIADIGRRPSASHSLDRINNDGNYEPGNCRWATRLEQSRNLQKTTYVEYRGAKLPLLDVYDFAPRPITYNALRSRLRLGWELDAALTTPKRGHALTLALAGAR